MQKYTHYFCVYSFPSMSLFLLLFSTKNKRKQFALKFTFTKLLQISNAEKKRRKLEHLVKHFVVRESF